MLGLVAVTTVAAMQEKKARAKALKQFAPQPIDDASMPVGADPMDDGFGQPDELADFDEDAFK